MVSRTAWGPGEAAFEIDGNRRARAERPTDQLVMGNMVMFYGEARDSPQSLGIRRVAWGTFRVAAEP